MEMILATRKSKLAQIQTDIIINLLKEKYKDVSWNKLLILTEGDKRLDVTLDKIGGKGVFIKEIERALIEKRAHGAIHSLKDVPFDVEERFIFPAIPVREDPRDAFVSLKGYTFKELNHRARVGTSSIRRGKQIKNLRPDIEIVPIRGNVQTRIDKIEKENLDGIVLAAAGLKRLGMEKIISDYFPVECIVPAVGQGALAVETLKNSDFGKFFEEIDDIDVRHAVEGERSFMRTLNGGCHTLIGAYGKVEGDDLYLLGTFNVDGHIVKKDISGKREHRIDLGKALAQKVLRGL